jgi:hypothetical protein
MQNVILPEPFGPCRLENPHALTHALSRVEFGAMALPVIEPQRLDASETLQRPRQADRRILPAGEQDKRAIGIHRAVPGRIANDA